MADMLRRLDPRFILLVVLAAILAACVETTPTPAAGEDEGKLHVVATTTLVGDVVRTVGGDAITLIVLLPPGAEPHGFQPSPQDLTVLAQADLVFVNGFDLEETLMPAIEGAIADGKIVSVSDGVGPIEAADAEHEAGASAEEEHDAGASAEEEHKHGIDPHTWTDPNNVMIWTDNIARALVAADPARKGDFESRAAAYKDELAALDASIREQVAQIPEGNRKLVTDHAVFGYFARRYGLEQIGAVVPGYSAVAEPSAKELAALEDTIRALGVKAVFVGNTVNPNLAERVANDTNTRLMYIYTDSLSDAGGPAATYLDFMRHNVDVFAEGLR